VTPDDGKEGVFMTEALIGALVEMDEDTALKETKALIDNGCEPQKILEACTTAMEAVGKRFEEGEYFLPHLMMAGEMLKQIADMVKPLLKEGPAAAAKGRVVMGTVKGDIHDIGKNIVTFLLEANGFEVRDIGVDQPPASFVAAIREFKPAVVGMSGLLTLAFGAMKETVAAIEAAGLRGEVRIMIGGSQVSEKVREFSGADAYGSDAMAGVRLCRQWIGG
jgi:5-methyltetrahydrofolate--homocysteine methyltransferase